MDVSRTATFPPTARIRCTPWDSLSDQRQLTTDRGYGEPQWSPDGSELVFVRFFSIEVMNVDGSGRRTLIRTNTTTPEPTWSPNGDKIAFVNQEVGQADIYTINPDGCGLTDLTNTADAF